MKNKDVFYNICPFISFYLYFENDSAVFLLPNELISFENVDVKLLLEVCRQCNGFNSIRDILKNTLREGKYKKHDVEDLLRKLFEFGVIIDIHEYYLLFHKISSNPMPYVKKLEDSQLRDMFKRASSFLYFDNKKQGLVENLLNKRISVRKFSKKKTRKDDLQRLIWSMYGRIERSNSYPENNIGLGTVPSGGSLYPLQLRIVLLKQVESYKKGIYYLKNGKMNFLKKVTQHQIETSFFGKQVFLKNSTACIVIGGNFSMTSQKYSNRGYRYSLIEAGHVAQNAYIWCAENDFGVVEICGFNDKKLSNLVGLNYPHEAALTTIFFGKA